MKIRRRWMANAVIALAAIGAWTLVLFVLRLFGVFL